MYIVAKPHWLLTQVVHAIRKLLTISNVHASLFSSFC